MQADSNTISDIVQRGREIYETKLRVTLDIPENFRKTVVIEPDSEDYEVDADLLQAVKRLQERHPDKRSYSLRIGKGMGAFLRGGRGIKK